MKVNIVTDPKVVGPDETIASFSTDSGARGWVSFIERDGVVHCNVYRISPKVTIAIEGRVILEGVNNGS